jgi:mannose-6-phosphate isomerase-like protein (cupin superfamily)
VAITPDRVDLLGYEVVYLHSDPDGRMALLEWRAPPNAGGTPVHVHHRTEEGFYVLRGELALLIEGEQRVLGPGAHAVAHAGQAHTFWNPSDEPAAYLMWIAPAGVDRYLRELAVGLQQAPSEQDAAALRARLGEAYDVTVVGPPPPRG